MGHRILIQKTATRNPIPATRETRRWIVRHRRSSPDDQIPRRLIVRPDGRQFWQPALKNKSWNSPDLPVPAEIWIRLSEPDSENHTESIKTTGRWDFAPWLESVQTRWTGQKIDIYFLCFDRVSIQKELFHRLRALGDRRLPWRTLILTDGNNIASTAILDQLLRATPDELHVYLAGLGESAVSPRVLNAVKDLVDLRSARRQNQPEIIGRLCPNPAVASRLIPEISRWARQVGLDRLEVLDNLTEEKRLWAL